VAVKKDIVQELVKVLEFYANPDTYFAIAILPDPPCGEFMTDYSDKFKKPGTRARKVLRKYYKQVKKK